MDLEPAITRLVVQTKHRFYISACVIIGGISFSFLCGSLSHVQPCANLWQGIENVDPLGGLMVFIATCISFPLVFLRMYKIPCVLLVVAPYFHTWRMIIREKQFLFGPAFISQSTISSRET